MAPRRTQRVQKTSVQDSAPQLDKENITRSSVTRKSDIGPVAALQTLQSINSSTSSTTNAVEKRRGVGPRSGALQRIQAGATGGAMQLPPAFMSLAALKGTVDAFLATGAPPGTPERSGFTPEHSTPPRPPLVQVLKRKGQHTMVGHSQGPKRARSLPMLQEDVCPDPPHSSPDLAAHRGASSPPVDDSPDSAQWEPEPPVFRAPPPPRRRLQPSQDISPCSASSRAPPPRPPHKVSAKPPTKRPAHRKQPPEDSPLPSSPMQPDASADGLVAATKGPRAKRRHNPTQPSKPAASHKPHPAPPAEHIHDAHAVHPQISGGAGEAAATVTDPGAGVRGQPAGPVATYSRGGKLTKGQSKAQAKAQLSAAALAQLEEMRSFYSQVVDQHELTFSSSP